MLWAHIIAQMKNLIFFRTAVFQFLKRQLRVESAEQHRDIAAQGIRHIDACLPELCLKRRGAGEENSQPD